MMQARLSREERARKTFGWIQTLAAHSFGLGIEELPEASSKLLSLVYTQAGTNVAQGALQSMPACV